ncbi:hypothetical protein pEaSNUABM40_00252 [Erwinia phage pEa_SNUABM_40]|uniref:Uncharacterized protein n=1 Tax=Erwinia phage pEa_SNUABM_3 TaxID=2869552 RepID=A0AAE7XJ91_9CAUD|nr:hypothetical protein MPK68_gp249 [Erwinia phage pEa_SNUABM_3]QZE56784.1 hypothetical protein pEaSNUABM20_00248 [Erwinia phage pEa_SNUABM_20]QZE58468.1 hypothetical protein pEaSNUABM40_00252 [Erwinia phage pEa_SNUABM_40]UAW53029.1 hypothetical protein pEaSNUABM23_00247 [Erwinia phage pEa_SNUABM_23]UIW10924.1 hypothetical protein pEaSNUABM23_00247 [Erwinia phage pEa_SNUABM_31]QZE56446.1 hypothetical protein pEaSNUABM3_00249 [Erwinia phage pEa_SNUABM_3]
MLASSADVSLLENNMCERSHLRLKYLARSSNWCNNKVNACSERKARDVQCEEFLAATKDCRSIQNSSSVVSFFSGQELVGQAIWREIEGDNMLQFRLLLA